MKTVTISGKGGVGKTTVTALLLDELARIGFTGKVLAVDGDPAMTLNIALGLPEPIATVADIRDTAQLSGKGVKNIPGGLTRDKFLKDRMEKEGVLQTHKLRGMPLTLMAMGRGEGKHCYCSVNHTLSQALKEVMGDYDLVVIDNEAGLEHLSRYRVERADYFIVIAGPDKASQVVAKRVFGVAKEVQMKIGQAALVINRSRNIRQQNDKLYLPDEAAMNEGEMIAVSLPDDSPLRLTVRSELLFTLVGNTVPTGNVR